MEGPHCEPALAELRSPEGPTHRIHERASFSLYCGLGIHTLLRGLYCQELTRGLSCSLPGCTQTAGLRTW